MSEGLCVRGGRFSIKVNSTDDLPRYHVYCFFLAIKLNFVGTILIAYFIVTGE